MVDGAAVVGSPGRRLKTRFPSGMRPTREMKAYALAAAFEPKHIQNIFETFRSWNLARGTYSTDWEKVWCNWVDRQVDIETEDHHRWRARAYLERMAQF